MNKTFQISRFLLIIVALLLIKCNSETNVDCVQCNANYKYDSITHQKVRPDKVALIIYVTINSENPKVPVVIYKGKFDLNNMPPVARRDTFSASKDTIIVPAEDHDYTVEAEYKVKGNSLSAISGDYLSIREIKQACDSICWTVSGNEINVELGYSNVGK